MKNFEKIKQMTLEEMAEYFGNVFCVCVSGCKSTNCSECIKEWLNQEVEEC